METTKPSLLRRYVLSWKFGPRKSLTLPWTFLNEDSLQTATVPKAKSTENGQLSVILRSMISVPSQLASLDAEGRSILTEHRCVGEVRIVVVNVYCPMVDSDNQERLGYKLKFYATLQDRCTALERAGK